MDRKDFLRKGLMGTGMIVTTAAMGDVIKNDIDELQPLEALGFNHITNTDSKIMSNTVLHRAASRGEGAGGKEQGARSREQGAGSREQGARSKEQGAGSKEQGARSREQGAGSREQGAGSRENA